MAKAKPKKKPKKYSQKHVDRLHEINEELSESKAEYAANIKKLQNSNVELSHLLAIRTIQLAEVRAHLTVLQSKIKPQSIEVQE